jgi:signal peptidase II
MARWVFFLLATAVFALDQATKHWAMNSLSDDYSVTIIPAVFYLTRTTNTGAAFGVLPHATLLLAFAALVAVLGIAAYALRTSWPIPALMGVALALPLGGAAGNFLDRIRLGRVIDFLDVRFGSYTWPIFNIADSAICIGVGLLVIAAFRSSRLDKPAVNDKALL